MIIAIEIILWATIGIWSFIYFWTKNCDLTGDEVGCLLIAAALGPITFIVQWIVRGDDFLNSDKIWIKRRNRK